MRTKSLQEQPLKLISFLFSFLYIFSFSNISFTSKVYAGPPKELKDLYYKASGNFYKAWRARSNKEEEERLYKLALEQVNFLLRVAPTYAKAYQLRSEIKINSNITLTGEDISSNDRDIKGALSDINKAIKIEEKNHEFYQDRAEIYEELYDEAKSDLAIVSGADFWCGTDENPKHKINCLTWCKHREPIYFDCKNLNYKNKNKSKIKSKVQKTINKYKIKILSDYDRSISLNKVGRNEYKEHEDTSWTYYSKASFLYYKNKDYNQALSNLNQAIKLIKYVSWGQSKNNMYRRLRAQTFLELDNVKAACNDINSVKTKEPNFDFYLNYRHKDIVKNNC